MIKNEKHLDLDNTYQIVPIKLPGSNNVVIYVLQWESNEHIKGT